MSSCSFFPPPLMRALLGLRTDALARDAAVLRKELAPLVVLALERLGRLLLEVFYERLELGLLGLYRAVLVLVLVVGWKRSQAQQSRQ